MVWWFAKVAFIFLYSAVNPVIYGMTNRTFRKAFKSSRILSMICRFEEKQVSVIIIIVIMHVAHGSRNEIKTQKS